MLLPPFAPTHHRWQGDLRELLTAEELQSRRRSPRIAAARRLVLLAGERLGRPRVELAALVSISSAGASHLLRRDPKVFHRLSALANDVARACWGTAADGA